ncbi:hypothetical protein KKG22_00365 [Patescibacteria group bacterium]|nr:hypothetical protein [Patescibacteria group bacterium]MBU1722129.1 hypothetical protein [Patescibacteria group bacterium]MBU1901178.1 hypothetical protein [Patescibacteria group bacterium]
MKAMKMAKKAFTWSVVLTTILWSVGAAALAPLAVSAVEDTCPTLSAGDLYMVPGDSAVFYLTEDGKGRYFPNGQVFEAWYGVGAGSYDGTIHHLAAACTGAYEQDSAQAGINFPPGSLVKVASSPRVYYVGFDNSVQYVGSEADARSLFGDDWATRVRGIHTYHWANYHADGASDLDASMYPEGMLVRVDGVVYYIMADGAYEVTGDLGHLAAMVVDGELAMLPAPAAETMTVAEITADPSQGAAGVAAPVDPEEPVVIPGALSVSLSANSPAGGNVIKDVNVEVAKFMFAAGSDADVKVNTVKIGRAGLGATSDFASITLYDGSTKLGTTKSSWASDGTMNYNISGGWVISAGTSKELTIVANISTANTYNALGVAGVTLASGTVSGVPVYAGQMSAVSVTVGRVTVTNQGSATLSKKIGSNDVTLAEFRLAVNSVEDAKLRSITLKNKAASNNASDGDIANVYLYQGTTMLAGPVSMVSDKITFDISEDAWFLIKKSKNADFKVIGDIVDGKDNTIEFVLDATTDITMIGENYNSQLYVTATAYDAATKGSIVTIEGSQLNIAYTGAPLETTDDKTDVEFGSLTLNAGNTDVKITTLKLTVTETDGNSDVTDNLDVDEFELVAADGTTYSGVVGADGDANANAEVWTFSDEIYLNAGETLELTMRGDLPDGIGAEDSYKVTMTVNTTNLVAETVPAGDAVASFSIGSFNGKLVTVKTPYLVVKAIDMNSTLKAVVNQEDVVIFKGTLEAVSDTITLSRLKFEGGHATAGDVTLTVANLDSDNWSNLGLYTVSSEGVYTLVQNVNYADLTTGYVDFNSFSLDIPAGSANKVTFAVKGTVSATLDTDGPNTTVHAQLDTVTVKDSDGDSRLAKNSAGTTIANATELETTTKYTLGGTGILYVALRNADTGYNKDRVVLAGDGAWVAKLRLKAEYEDVKLVDLKLTNNSSDDEDSVEEICLYTAEVASAENLIGCTTLDTNDIASFTGLDYIVSEGTEDVYVYAKTRAMSNGALGTADTGDLISMKITTTTGHLTARGMDSNTELAYGDLATPEAGEIVFDLNLNGTFDEAADAGGTATGKSFYVAGSRISNVQLVDGYNCDSNGANCDKTVDTDIISTGAYTVAILAITNESNSNTDAEGNALIAAINGLIFDVTKFASTTISGATIDRIGGTQAAAALNVSGADGDTETSGDWTFAAATSTLGVDSYIPAGTTAYFEIVATVSGLNATTGVADWVRVGLDDVTGGVNDANNNIDWFDGYDTAYATASNIDYLFLDVDTIAGTKVSEKL